jgi:hypothetical protein
MTIRKFAGLFAAMSCLLIVGAGSASATTVLRLDPGNTAFTGSNTITNTSSSNATLSLTGLGEINCASTKFDADVNSGSSATTIGGTLTALTFTSCTDTLPVITINSCHLYPVGGAFPSLTINAINDTGGTQTINDATVFCPVAGSTSGCYYTAATAVGTGNNAASTLSYNNVAVSTVTPTTNNLGAACGSSGFFSVTLNHIVQGGTNKTVTVRQS